MIKTSSKLRHRITIQRPVDTPDTAGFEADAWEDVVTVWAAAKDMNGREYIAANAAQMESTVTFTIRQGPNVDSTMRLLFRGWHYNIQNVGHGEYRGDFIDLRAVLRDVAQAGG